MVSQLGSKPAFGSGDEKPDERRDFGGFTTMCHQEILGWGAYLPLPGFDKKGRMVLMCQMEVLCTKYSDDHQKIFPAEDQPCKDQLQPPDVGLSDDHLHSSQGGVVATNMMKRCCL